LRIVNFGPAGAEQPGILADDETVVPVSSLMRRLGVETPTVGAVLGLLSHLHDAFDDAVERREGAFTLRSVRLGAPLPESGRVLLVGQNYASHVSDTSDYSKDVLPELPLLLSKPSTAKTGAYDDVVRPSDTEQLDYEIELGVVIGRSGRRIDRTEALSYVAGYVVANDITARDVSLGEAHKSMLLVQLFKGKGYDGFLPAGPWVTTADEVADPQQLHMRLWVNGELRQDAPTSQMIHDVAACVSAMSEAITLYPGDVILTGTPGGIGWKMDPPVFLQSGDMVRSEISSLGFMENRVVDEAVAG
jgi:2,4-diketo-3-deoxy-L-fuconate hydrolase